MGLWGEGAPQGCVGERGRAGAEGERENKKKTHLDPPDLLSRRREQHKERLVCLVPLQHAVLHVAAHEDV
jgi:hypothetical protein